jgi:hypothetical protein
MEKERSQADEYQKNSAFFEHPQIPMVYSFEDHALRQSSCKGEQHKNIRFPVHGCGRKRVDDLKPPGVGPWRLLLVPPQRKTVAGGAGKKSSETLNVRNAEESMTMKTAPRVSFHVRVNSTKSDALSMGVDA